MDKSYARKRFSQNFLNDQNILNKIINVVDLSNKNILEIGPGKGSLTKHLLAKAKQVIAFEIDHNLFEYLKSEFTNSNFNLINKDFLKEDLSAYQDFYIISNIPYHISTEIVFKIFENYPNFPEVVLLVQKEFGKRLCAKVSTKDYSKLSPSTSLFYEATYCFDVDAKSFWPQPKVTSCVVHLKRKEGKYDVDYHDFLNFIKTSFSMRRKTFWNNIKQIYHFDFNYFQSICNEMEINTNIRPENLSLDQLLVFYKKLKNTSTNN